MEAVSHEIREIADNIKNNMDCEQIYLFGSYAYGKPNVTSDYDLYVIIPDDTLRPLEAIKRAYGILSRTKMSVPVDILAMNATKFKERSNMFTLERKVVKEGVALYD